MKRNLLTPPAAFTIKILFILSLALVPLASVRVHAQDGSAQPAASETELAQRRLTRARALAAIGKLAAAAGELESLRAATSDESVRDVARVLLAAIYVEMPDYARARALLDEAFDRRARGPAADAATHAYFALAGQLINAVRTHLDRYRAFGVNIADGDLPAEANGDLEQLRGLLERVVTQAKTIGEEQQGKGEGATALLEDAATVRMRVARHDHDRAAWQSEVSEARQRLFASETRLASISAIPARRAPTNAQAAPPSTSATTSNNAAAPATSRPQNTSAGANTQPPAPAQTNVAPAAGGGSGHREGAPVAIGSLSAVARQRVTPSYPSIARVSGVTGVVTVHLIVNEKGEVESVQRADGPAALQQAATDAARRWKFHPTLIDGQPVRVSGHLSFDFKP